MSVKDKNQPQERYLKIPNHILNIPPKAKVDGEFIRFTRGDRLLYGHIYSFGTKGCWESNQTLAETLFVCSLTIKRGIAKLRKAKYISVKAAHSYYRTLYANTNPDVKAAQKVWYNRREIPKTELQTGQEVSTQLGTKVYQSTDKSIPVEGTKVYQSLVNICTPTNNHTTKEIKKDIIAPPTPSPDKRASAALTDRKKQQQKELKEFEAGFGAGPRKERKRLSQVELQNKAQEQRKQLLDREKFLQKPSA